MDCDSRVCFVFSSASDHGQADPIALEAIQKYFSGVELVDVGGGDSGYFDALANLWGNTPDRDLVIVERDIVVRPKTVSRMRACSQGDYCSWDYPIASGPTRGAGLGCIKFTKELISEVPGLFAEVDAINWPHSGSNRSWTRLDGRIHHVLQRLGQRIHVHYPSLWHRNERNSANYSSPPAGYLRRHGLNPNEGVGSGKES